MNLQALPEFDKSTLIAKLLNETNATWHRSTSFLSTCKDFPCKQHPERTVKSGVAYYVTEGLLRGTWSELGDDADAIIFDRMLEQLGSIWREKLDGYKSAALMMRSVGK